MKSFLKLIQIALHFVEIHAAKIVLSVFLLAIRIIWGYQFFLAGKGKLADISKPAAFFAELGIPLPKLNAYMAGTTECVGGLLLLLGLFSRPVAFALTVVMSVAYLTADKEAVAALFQDGEPAKFIAAAPFYFMVTSVLVLALGPGLFSLDKLIRALLHKWGFGCSESCPTPAQ